MAREPQKMIRRRALRVLQNAERPLYLFSLQADEILKIADISRLSRDDAGEIIGYQRPEVKQHVEGILAYLDNNQGKVVFPNSIILSLSSATVFRQVRGTKVDKELLADAGTIEILIPRPGEPKPAWIVDGQQRALALSKCKRHDFPVPVNAFIADDVETQREQFLLVNNTKPLPRGLINELLPEVDTILPPNLAMKRAPAALCEILSKDPESPFCGLIRHSSSRQHAGKDEILTGAALIQVIQDSLLNPSGCLFPYRNVATNETDFAGIQNLLHVYWGAVKDTFPDAWGLPPTRSRLMHTVGLQAMGKLMDRVMVVVDPRAPDARQTVHQLLAPLAGVCRWTSGTWEELRMRWDEPQNISPHIRLLTNYLLRAYQASRGAGR